MMFQGSSAAFIRRLRATAALLVTMFAGYLSLATSCLGSSSTKTVRLKISFDEDDEFKMVRIRALTESVVFGFDQPVVVPFARPPMAGPPPDLNLGGAPELDGSTSEPPPADQPSDPVAECVPENAPYVLNCHLSSDESGSFGNGSDEAPTDTILRIFRYEQVGAFDVEVRARATFFGDCNGELPETMAIRLDEVSE